MAPNFHIVLFQPVIPQNTGSIARLCAATGATLHLIHPLGFSTSDAAVKRAGLDYWPHVTIREHLNWQVFLEAERPERLFFFSKFASRSYTTTAFSPPCYLVFGNETEGLPQTMRSQFAELFFLIPIRRELVRSLNLSQSAAIVLYEAMRQNQFADLD